MTDTTLKLAINSLPKEARLEIEAFVKMIKNKVNKNAKINKRQYGFAKGKIILSNDFNSPLKDFKEYM